MMIPPRGAPRLATTVLLTTAIAGSIVIQAPVATAAPAPAPAPRDGSLHLSVSVASDGLGRFSDDDRPGGDSGPANGIVRTSDAVVYSATLAATAGTASGVV